MCSCVMCLPRAESIIHKILRQINGDRILTLQTLLFPFAVSHMPIGSSGRVGPVWHHGGHSCGIAFLHVSVCCGFQMLDVGLH